MNKSRNNLRNGIYERGSLLKEMQVNEQQRNIGEMLDSKEDKNYQMGLKTVKI